jgi:hypothetical protein
VRSFRLGLLPESRGAFSLSTASQIYSQSASEKDAKEKEKKKSRKSEAN